MNSLKFTAVAIAALAFASPALACSCLFPESAEQQFENSELVFLGTVVDTGPKKVERSFWSWFTPWRAPPEPAWDAEHVTTFQVDRMLKGPKTMDTITFVHGVSGASCGVRYQTQQSGVFIGYKQNDGFYSTSLCGSARFSAEEFIEVSGIDE